MHTPDGGYKTFTDLISSDGYQIDAGTGAFTPGVLAAFTVDECLAVRDWGGYE